MLDFFVNIHFMSLKSTIKNIKIAMRHNVYGLYCPDCSLRVNKPTAYIHRGYDKLYKKDKIYIKCNSCDRVTPMYEDEKDLLNTWDDLFIDKEVDIVEDSCRGES